MEHRAEYMTQRVLPFLMNTKTVIDVGSGNCLIAKKLMQTGRHVTPVDIRNQSLEPSVHAHVFDGKTLPYKNNSFDVGLLLTVMHHTPSPEKLFQEVSRVSKQIVVIETSYRNLFEKFFIVLFDSLLNGQLKIFWNSYKSDIEWKKFFENQGFTIQHTKHYIDMQGAPYFHPLYVVTKTKK